MIANLDGINNGISRPAFESSFTAVIEWDMCAANQTGGYYDIYALRAKGWRESDYLRELEVKSQGLNNSQLFHFGTPLIYDRMKKLIDNRLG